MFLTEGAEKNIYMDQLALMKRRGRGIIIGKSGRCTLATDHATIATENISDTFRFYMVAAGLQSTLARSDNFKGTCSLQIDICIHNM
jgi:hypothetical protein